MNKAFNILLIAAVLVGLFAAFLVVRLLESYKDKPAPAQTEAGTEIEMQTVAFAKVDIQPGTQIDTSLLSFEPMPTDLVPPGAVTKETELGNRMAAHLIPEGDIMLMAKMKTPESFGRASLIIPQGMRTVTIPVNDLDGNSYLPKNGDIVDIVLTTQLYDNDNDPIGMNMSRIFMQGIKIFDIQFGESVEEQTGQEPEGSTTLRRGRGSTVTFLASPQDAEILVNASRQENAVLTLLLRRYDDFETVTTSGVVRATLQDVIQAEDYMPDEPIQERPVVEEDTEPAPPPRPFF